MAHEEVSSLLRRISFILGESPPPITEGVKVRVTEKVDKVFRNSVGTALSAPDEHGEFRVSFGRYMLPVKLYLAQVEVVPHE